MTIYQKIKEGYCKIYDSEIYLGFGKQGAEIKFYSNQEEKKLRRV